MVPNVSGGVGGALGDSAEVLADDHGLGLEAKNALISKRDFAAADVPGAMPETLGATGGWIERGLDPSRCIGGAEAIAGCDKISNTKASPKPKSKPARLESSRVGPILGKYGAAGATAF